ncbi:MAG: glycosyltransferase WbuB, partial [Bacteroidota bacterium]|nr:glycosyltransferase WbuB [Bacteroidota bacterium]
MSKSVVFIGHYNGGKKDFDSRHYFFAKELAKLGYKATIINAAYSHRIHNAKLIKEPYIKFYDDGVCFISVKTPFYKGNGLKRIINMLSFTKNLIKYSKGILKEIGGIDYIVMATPHPFQFFGAKFISIRSSAKLIIDVKD